MASSRLFAASYRPAMVASATSLLALHENSFVSCHPDDDFPNFSRHGPNSLLKEFLTPHVYRNLKTKQTCNGVTLDDIIRSGTCLPYGATRRGVFAGDAESYKVFAELFDPIIDRHHRRARRNKYPLQRFQTNLNPQHLLQTRLDKNGAYILYTRMRLARSIAGFRFPTTMDRVERRTVETIITKALKSWEGEYRPVMEMQNKKHDDLIRRRLLFHDPTVYTASAGLGRDWPDNRGIYCDTWKTTPKIMIWVNAYDHLWIISNTKGGDVQGVFSNLSKTVAKLEEALKSDGHSFVEDKRLGFLNTSPADIGTALRASVVIKLVRLGRLENFPELIRKLRLEVRLEDNKPGKQYTGIFDIGNAEALGKTEVQLINIMIRGVEICIDLERKLEMGEEVDIDEIPEL